MMAVPPGTLVAACLALGLLGQVDVLHPAGEVAWMAGLDVVARSKLGPRAVIERDREVGRVAHVLQAIATVSDRLGAGMLQRLTVQPVRLPGIAVPADSSLSMLAADHPDQTGRVRTLGQDIAHFRIIHIRCVEFERGIDLVELAGRDEVSQLGLDHAGGVSLQPGRSPVCTAGRSAIGKRPELSG